MGRFINLVSGLIFSLAASVAVAQAWPNKPVKLIVPYPAGGLTDVLARGLSAEIVKLWGQSLVIENRPGASQMIGAEALAKSPPDGYTLAMLDKTPLAINPYLFSKIPYDPVKDFAPVINVVQTSQVLVANPGLQANTLTQLIELARSNPGGINYGTFGAGSITHLDTEAFAAAAGIKLTHIPYKGIAEVLPAVAAGQIQIALSGIPPMLPLARQGRIKVLGAMTPQRVPVLPDVPTFGESGYQLVSSSWFALFAPAGTPRSVIDKIAADVGRVISQKDFDDRFISGVGLELINQGPDQLAATVAADRVKYQAYVKAVNVKLD
jgi:tripartite-type tricarboxylate transporter receptor subunit TctC